MEAQPFYLSGAWESSTEKRLVRNPYDGNIVGLVAYADRSVVLRAIQLADQVRPIMQSLTSYVRSQVLSTVADRIADHKDDLARLITLESGKPIKGSRVEVDRAVVTFKTASEEAKRIEGELLPMDVIPGQPNHWGLVRRFPVGIVAGITPFNSPLNLVAHKIAPALASGNCVIIKPAPQAPLTALFLARLFDGCDLPPGVLSIIPCSNADAEPLVTDDRIGMLSFTGSTVGWKLKEKAPHKVVTLELGGNAGIIVHEDADLDLAVQRAVAGAFSSSGQRCISVQRIYLHRPIAGRFCDRFIPAVSRLVIADPLDPRTDIGPLITEDAAIRTLRWVEEAVAAGAELVCGGTRDGSIVAPTVLFNPPTFASVCREEVFAPVVILREYDTFEDAIDEVNDSHFGLQAGVFTRDMQRIFYSFEKLQVGGVMINEASTYRMEHMPYGGMKLSGLGREGIRYAIETMTERKILVLNLDQAGSPVKQDAVR
ncbi:MAG TPA: aldehyde dehydrogenase [Chloroflexi bacterium]|nr:aldehyde dehydrogenase [Chloroflexota bacterium]